MDDKNKISETLKKTRIRWGFGIIVLSIFWLYAVWNFVSPGDNITDYITEEIDYENPDFVLSSDIDSTDIVDGIHIPSGLIADTGFEVVMTNCSACHSLDLVIQNRATREGWKEIITWMQETQKLWDLGKQEDIILDYLAKNYSPDNVGRRKKLESIEWYKLEL